MIERRRITQAYNNVPNRPWLEMISDNYSGYYELELKVQMWLRDSGFDWPMTEEQEVEFKLRYL